ncbi:MAG: prepilin peptidase [Chloroflexota bacterium]
MSALLIAVFVLLGFAVGSFLNVCIDRLPQGQSILKPPSHCPACNKKLSVLDLVPVFSYLWLRSRCRYCQSPIPRRLPIVEGITGLFFGLFYMKFGLSPVLGMILLYTCLLLIIFVIDLENQLVLDVVVYPGMVLALVFSFFWPGGNWLNALKGGAIGLAVLALPFLIYRKGMGIGDIKLGALIGLMSGFPLIFVTLLIAFISGGLVGSMLLVFHIKGRKDAIPFAPFLTSSTLITLLWGAMIYHWYFPT